MALFQDWSGPLRIRAHPGTNVELRLRLLMAHARYRGWIVDKKQIARASIHLGEADPEEMRAHVGQYLDALAPGAITVLRRH